MTVDRTERNQRQRSRRARIRRELAGVRSADPLPTRAFRFPVPKHVATDRHHCPGVLAFRLLYGTG